MRAQLYVGEQLATSVSTLADSVSRRQGLLAANVSSRTALLASTATDVGESLQVVPDIFQRQIETCIVRHRHTAQKLSHNPEISPDCIPLLVDPPLYGLIPPGRQRVVFFCHINRKNRLSVTRNSPFVSLSMHFIKTCPMHEVIGQCHIVLILSHVKIV